MKIKQLRYEKETDPAICQKKKNDLIKLCGTEVIPVEYHGWYFHLPSANFLIHKCPELSQNEYSDEDQEFETS